jgi:NUDIX domain-containing protein
MSWSMSWTNAIDRSMSSHRCALAISCIDAEIAIRNTAGEIWVHRRTDTKDVYPGLYDMVVGGVLASGEAWEDGARRELKEEPEEIAWGAFVTVHELDRMLRAEEFCPDSVAIFELWRDGRLDP